MRIIQTIGFISFLLIAINSANGYAFNENMAMQNPFNRNILIELSDNYKSIEVDKAFECLGIRDITPDNRNIRKAIITSGLELEAIKSSLIRSDFVLNVELESSYFIDAVPNDTLFKKQWALNNIGQTGGKNDADIDAIEAWSIKNESKEIIVAIIDTGIDYNHSDLKENIWINTDELPGNNIDDDNNGYIDDTIGWDFYNWDNDPNDDNAPIYHGTHVSGIIGASGNNSHGVTGVSWKVSIMPLKSFNSYGSASTYDIVNAIYYAVDNGAQVINASWGSLFYSDILYNAILYAKSKGVVLVASSGNLGLNADSLLRIKFGNRILGYYPATYDLNNIISVAASDHNDNIAEFSNFGKESIDVLAPGVEILSTQGFNSYGWLSGTSMAAPYVSGTVSLVFSKFSGINPEDAVNMICKSVDLIPGYENFVKSGGRLNLEKSLLENYESDIPEYAWKYIYYYISEINQ